MTVYLPYVNLLKISVRVSIVGVKVLKVLYV